MDQLTLQGLEETLKQARDIQLRIQKARFFKKEIFHLKQSGKPWICYKEHDRLPHGREYTLEIPNELSDDFKSLLVEMADRHLQKLEKEFEQLQIPVANNTPFLANQTPEVVLGNPVAP